MPDIVDIEGIGTVYAQKLKDAGISTTDALLAQGATVKGRDDLVAKTGISGTLILDWVNRADLFRISGVGEQFSDLLAAGGVATVPELAQRVPANLHQRLVAVNDEKKLVRRVPTEQEVGAWIETARSLPRVVEY